MTLDPLCIMSMKSREPCAICSGNRGKRIVHTKAELEELGYAENEK